MISCCSSTGEMIRDYLTGRDVPECDDENIRQSIERLLVVYWFSVNWTNPIFV